MSVEKSILYIKGEQSIEVKKRDVTLGDLVKMECSDTKVLPKLKSHNVLKIPDQGKHRYVLSILTIIECIHKEYPHLEIQNMGAPDMIVTYEEQKKTPQIVQVGKIAFVTALSFIGAAFAIMTFNNDSESPKLFSQIYELVMGKPQEGFSVLELTYSLGLGVGILLFFNHFGKRKFTIDPTPIEVEMRLYENDLQTTIVSDYSRKGREMDVD